LLVIPYLRSEFPAEHIVNLVRAAGGSEKGEPVTLVAKLEAKVSGEAQQDGAKTRLRVEAEKILYDGEWKNTTGAIWLTVKGHIPFDSTERLRFTASLREPYNYGNPGEFDYISYMKLKSVFVTGFVKDPATIERIESASTGPAQIHRKRIRRLIDSSGARNREFLKALITGDRGGIDEAEKEAFKRTGVAHILAISGLHVGVVALFGYYFAIVLLKRSETLMLAFNIKKAAVAFSLIPVLLYAATAGFQVSTTRAVIMVAAFGAAFFLNRGRDFLNTIALAALIILLASPYSVWDLSFQLSFSAVFAIVYMTPRLDALIPKNAKKPAVILKDNRFASLAGIITRKLRPAFLVTLAAGAATAPILAVNFHRVSLVGMAANLVAVPLTGVVVPLLLTGSLLAYISAGLATVFVMLADTVFTLLISVVNAFGSLPYASVWVGTPTTGEVVLYYALLITAVNIKKHRLLKYAAILFVALLAADRAYYAWGKKSPDLRVTFISVGQGDSELVETPGGAVMLIDGGGVWGGFDVGEKVLAPFLWSKKISRIDYLVLSHAQRDHMDGLRFIAENFSVGEFWYNGYGDLKALGRTLEKKGVPVRRLDSTAAARLVGGAKVETLNPAAEQVLDPNDMSLVLRVSYGDRSFLFTWDIAKAAEEALAKKDVRVDVLKAPHHGSQYSSSEVFLNAVCPSVVVVSAGRYNGFHFPHVQTLKRYAQAGAMVLRTDMDGAVTVSTDGARLDEQGYLTGPRR